MLVFFEKSFEPPYPPLSGGQYNARKGQLSQSKDRADLSAKIGGQYNAQKGQSSWYRFKKLAGTFVMLFFCWGALASEPAPKPDSKTGYRYVLENYFSKRKSFNSDPSPRYFFLSLAGDFYRAKQDETLKSFSSIELAYTQNLKEISYLGDLQFRVHALSSLLEDERHFSLELTPLLTVPESRILFPVYLSVGLGAGLFPKLLIEEEPAFSVHALFSAGLRFFNLYHNLGLALELNLKAYYPVSLAELHLQAQGGLQLIMRF